MGEGSDFRTWDELFPDALGLIFSNLSLQEILTVIPRVCKSWGNVVKGPYCWQDINIEEWSNRCHRPDLVDRMLQLLLRRCPSPRKLCVSGLHNNISFSFIAEHASSIRTLRLPRTDICESVVDQIVGKLSTITFLDLSYCNKINASALETIGKNCKLLVGLCRNLHPVDTLGKPLQDEEAYAIARTMPRLKHLEMAYHLLSTPSVIKILMSCPELEFFDLRGCWDVNIDDKFLKEKFPKLKALGPLVVDSYETNDWDDCSDYSDGSLYLAWEFVTGQTDYYDDDDGSYDETWDDEGRLEELELRFYEGIDEDAGTYGWPLSP